MSTRSKTETGGWARLIMNLTLARAGYPPVIIKSSAHKSWYFDALAASDQGGDLLPLLTLFSRLLKTPFREITQPETAVRLWRLAVQREEPSAYLRWLHDVQEFIGELDGSL